MNAPELADLTLPVNPEVCWRICVALLHSAWQVLVLALLVFAAARKSGVSVHTRFRFSFVCLTLAGCLPLINYHLLSTPDALPEAVVSATQQFQSSGSLSLFRPSELAAVERANTSIAALAPGTPTATPHTHLETTDNYWQVSTVAIITLVYLLGVAAMLLRLGKSIKSQHRLKTLTATSLVSEKSHPKLLMTARRAASSLGRKLNTRIAVFESAGTAFVVGIFRPVILVNASLLSGLTPAQLQQILVHELAHIFRFDPITQLLQRVVESILFFHPGIWWISREVSHLRELCCDDMAARTSTSAEFADTLLQCYQLQQSKTFPVPELALPAIGQKNQLVARIDALLDNETNSGLLAVRRRPSLSLIARLSLAAIFLLAAQTVLSSGSSAQSVAIQSDSDTQKTKSTWQLNNNVDESDVEAPSLWFTGTRLETTTDIPSDILIDAMVDTDACRFCQWSFGNTLCKRVAVLIEICLLYTSPSPRDQRGSRMPSSA